jgi:hypothetical protein
VRGGADLDQVRVPGVLGDAEVIVALLLHVCVSTRPCVREGESVPFWCPCQRRGLRWRQCCCHVSGAIVAMAHSRYLEALTKRPAMVAVGVEEQGVERKEGGREAAARRRQAARRGGQRGEDG